ncbi:hypothetical protein V1514DRAFT_334197 [Lipomyces japonicus]|uniref:uncharacterized protein n=1 Tax=Lipomyces japonicus TaxID=56871 RepID=UPI0034CE330E
MTSEVIVSTTSEAQSFSPADFQRRHHHRHHHQNEQRPFRHRRGSGHGDSDERMSSLLLPVSYLDDTTDPAMRRDKLCKASRARQLTTVSILSRKSTLTTALTHVPQLPASFFDYFSHISVLKLGCGLQRLPPQIIHLKSLRSLDLRSNALVALPCQMQTMNLQRLLVDDVLTPDFTSLMLTDFVYRPEHASHASEDHKLSCLGPIPSLKEITLAVILRATPLSEIDIPGEFPPFSYVPSHLRPRVLPPDECAQCNRPLLVLLDDKKDKKFLKRYRKDVVALSPVVLEHIFCSRRCVDEMERTWRMSDIEQQIKMINRTVRFLDTGESASAEQ